jgi:signal transduction histidine kinase/CheY-like chemotaxis protein
MNYIRHFDIIFPREYMRAALLVSLLSVWVLVGLFYYLNRYTKRYYFNIWTAAWLFYALWLTIGITLPAQPSDSIVLVLRNWCISLSAVFLLWGSLAFLEFKTPQSLFGWFIAFLLVWSYAGKSIAKDVFYVQLPTFALTGIASMFSGVSFYRLRHHRQFVAVGMLFFGFFLWGVYLMTYPFALKFDTLINAGFLFSAVLQLFIAVSMIVLVLEEARHINEKLLTQMESVDLEKREMQIKILSAEENARGLFQQARLREELQSAYDELRQTQQSVVQQERLRALGQMASGVAHDVNNALSPILAFSEMLLIREANLSATARKNLEHIRTSAEDIAHIVSRMGEFYRRRENHDQLQLVSSNRLVQQVMDLTRPCWRDIPQSRGQEIQFQTCFEDPLPQLYCNESDLREALINLVLNAVDALPRGGLIRVSARATGPAGTKPESLPPSFLVIEVADNGVGMDENTRQRCLEPFFSTKKDRGGSGLGLAMVYGAMERHEGRIEVQSEEGKGTTIRLIFPLRQPLAGNNTEFPSAPAAANLHVLCIDDEPLMRELLKEVLAYHDHIVEVADNGQAGLDVFNHARSEGSPFDVVITDLGMPGLNGSQVTEAIKAVSPQTPVILLTGWGNMLEQKGEKVAEKNEAVLSKPPRINELTQTLAYVTRKSRRQQQKNAAGSQPMARASAS